MLIENDEVLQAFRTAPKCEFCGKENRHSLDPHHRRKRGMGGGSRLDIRINVASACRLPCHRDCENGTIPESRVLEVIAARERTAVEAIEEVVNLILRTPKGATQDRIRREEEALSARAKVLLFQIPEWPNGRPR